MEGAPFVINAPVVVEGRAARGRRGAAAAQNQVRLAGLLRDHGHADHRGTRHHVGRHRSGRPRRADLGGFRARARARARGRARQTHSHHPSTTTHGARSSASCRASRRTRCTRTRRASCTGRRSWRTRSATPAFGVPGRRVRDPQRPHGHGELHQRDPRSGLVGERRRADRARAHDAGSLRGLARANVVRARDARDRRLRWRSRSASSASTASSRTSSRNGRARSGSAWRSARSGARFAAMFLRQGLALSARRARRSASWRRSR